jgi:hypothetical protein
MRNENIAVNPPVETGPLTRRRFIGVAAMLALVSVPWAPRAPR